jgi:hypothetical protein
MEPAVDVYCDYLSVNLLEILTMKKFIGVWRIAGLKLSVLEPVTTKFHELMLKYLLRKNV